MGLIQLESDLDNARAWIAGAIDGITEGLEPEDVESYFKACPEMKVMQDKLIAIEAELKNIWTPTLKEQLKVEEEYQSDLEDRADAMSY